MYKIRKPVRAEWREQEALVVWMELNRIVFYHVPNGGKRDIVEAVKFKRIGVKAGVPDLCIPMPRKGYHGAYIELKRVSGGSLTEKQERWMRFLSGQGYFTVCCSGFEEAKKRIEWYFGKDDGDVVKQLS